MSKELNAVQPEEKKAAKPTKKVNKKKRKRIKRWIRFLVFLAVCTGIFFFIRSPYFNVKTVEVEGNSHFTISQIKAIADIEIGANMLRTEYDYAKEALMADPYIRLAEVKRVFPDTIKITVAERTEYAAVPYGIQYIVIDDEAMVLKVTEELPYLPLLGGMSITDMTPGKPLGVEQSYSLTEALNLVAAMEDGDLYFKRIEINKVKVKAYIYDELYCEGTAENIKNGIEQIRSVLEKMYSENITRGVLHVEDDNYITYSPKID